jgi:hypothetical protein
METHTLMWCFINQLLPIKYIVGKTVLFANIHTHSTEQIFVFHLWTETLFYVVIFMTFSTFYVFFFHWLYNPFGPWPLIFRFMIILQTVGLLGRMISSSQCLYLNTGQHKCRINAHTPNIHALCGIRTHNPSVRESLRPRGYRDRHLLCWK